MSPYLTSLFLFISNSSAVDTVRQSLEADSSRWFGWLVKASVLVGIGVILEAPEATIALKRWYRLWRGKDVKPQNEKSWVIPIAYLGLLLVVVGVAGEGVFESLSSQAETTLRGHDEQILGETESKFGQVKDSAETAAKAAGQAEASANTADASAKEASSKSGAAVTSAGSAVNLAKGARQEADSFEKDIVSANKTATEAEKHLAEALREVAQAEEELKKIRSPRSLVDVPALVANLKAFKGTEYTVTVFGDSDSLAFAKTIGGVLDQAGWIRKQPTIFPVGIPAFNVFGPKEAALSCFETGVQVHLQTTKTLEVLRSTPQQGMSRETLAAASLKTLLASSISPSDERNVGSTLWVDPAKNEGPVLICVGKKP